MGNLVKLLIAEESEELNREAVAVDRKSVV